jgi:hypothetical protein
MTFATSSGRPCRGSACAAVDTGRPLRCCIPCVIGVLIVAVSSGAVSDGTLNMALPRELIAPRWDTLTWRNAIHPNIPDSDLPCGGPGQPDDGVLAGRVDGPGGPANLPGHTSCVDLNQREKYIKFGAVINITRKKGRRE